MASTQEGVEIASRHQVYLEKLKSHEVVEYLPVIKQTEKAIVEVTNALGVNKLDELTAKELNSTLRQLKSVQNELVMANNETFYGEMQRLAGAEARFEAASMHALVNDLPNLTTPSAAKAFAAARATPLSATGQLLDPFTKSWSNKQIELVNNAVRKGWQEGQALSQVLQTVRGTRANKFKDGILAGSRRDAASTVRTASQHVSQTARMETWEANGDIVSGYRWVSTLDGRTSTTCRSMDGKVFEFEGAGAKPRPPIHVNCRSTTTAEFNDGLDFLEEGATRASKDGYVPADMTYYDWLKTQSADFQEDVLGPARAELFQSGKLTSKQFANLNLDRNFQPMNLDAMEAKLPTVLAAGGITTPSAGKVVTAATKTTNPLTAKGKAAAEEATKQAAAVNSAEAKAKRKLDEATNKMMEEFEADEKARKLAEAKAAAARKAAHDKAVKEMAEEAAAAKKAAEFKRKAEEIAKKKAALEAHEKLRKAEYAKQQAELAALKKKIAEREAAEKVTAEAKKKAEAAAKKAAAKKAAEDPWKDRAKAASSRIDPYYTKTYAQLQGELAALGRDDVVPKARVFKKLATVANEAKKDIIEAIGVPLEQRWTAADLFSPEAFKKLTPSQKRKITEAVEFLTKIVPKDRLPRNFKMFAQFEKGIRAHYDAGTVYLAPSGHSGSISTIIHEITHHLELYSGPQNKYGSLRSPLADTTALYKKRAKGFRLEKLSDLTGNSNYKPFEKAYRDHWEEKGWNVYAGKEYKSGAHISVTEILTLGMERLYADPLKFLLDDPEAFDIIISALQR